MAARINGQFLSGITHHNVVRGEKLIRDRIKSLTYIGKIGTGIEPRLEKSLQPPVSKYMLSLFRRRGIFVRVPCLRELSFLVPPPISEKYLLGNMEHAHLHGFIPVKRGLGADCSHSKQRKSEFPKRWSFDVSYCIMQQFTSAAGVRPLALVG